jgi:hypothetical protein
VAMPASSGAPFSLLMSRRTAMYGWGIFSDAWLRSAERSGG